MRQLLCLFFFVPFLASSQIQHLDTVQIKTIGRFRIGFDIMVRLQEKIAVGKSSYYLVYGNEHDAQNNLLIKFTGGQEVLDELRKTLLDAIAKAKGGKTFIKLGDQVLSMEVKKQFMGKVLDISTDAGEFQLNEGEIKKLFGV